jgi:glycerol-3-phosphate dehydrogenase
MACLSREQAIAQLSKTEEWDIVIIGGGATGLGIAVDSASRGFKTLLLERSDFAKGTSSRSTKLVHGGVRYLAQGNIKLVYDALRERGLLLRNAPHLVRQQSFVIPCYSTWSVIKYLVGLKLYDQLAGTYRFGFCRHLSRSAMRSKLSGIKRKGLKGGVEYFDGQFDDARLAINLAQTAAKQGGVLINHFKVTALTREGSKVNGVIALDEETNAATRIKARVVINATGVFVDDILQMDVPGRLPMVRPSQGVHIVLDRTFLKGDSALMIPQTSDGRVLFAVPWHDHLLVGTTDTPQEKHSMEPRALPEEVEFILSSVRQYLTRAPQKSDVLSVFAGLRPLAVPPKNTSATKEISRDHKLMVSPSGLITITGGKWTTYRKMAEETVNKAIRTAGLSPKPCVTKTLRIHGWTIEDTGDHFSIYGSDAAAIKAFVAEDPSLGKQLCKHLPYTEAEVIWCIRNEMARTVEDVLARRLRLLFLDAEASMEAAPRVVELLAMELNQNEDWKRMQLLQFIKLASQYMLQPYPYKTVSDQKTNVEDEYIF